MNNEVNDNIETLDVETPSQDDKLNNTGLMDIIKQNKINADNGVSQQPNFTVNPNAYHPSLNNNQPAVQTPPEPVNNVVSEPTIPVSAEPVQTSEKPSKGLKSLSIDKFAIVLLLIVLVSHFLIVPHVVLRLYVNTIGEFIVNRAVDALFNGQSFGFYFWLYFLFVPILTVLIASFSVVVYAVINVVKKGEMTYDMIPFAKKSLMYSFFASFALMFILQFLHTDFITPVLRITTFNGLQLTMFESLF